ncbi:cyclic lactone autoinducer peptide [Paenibacillus camelliae]|uniref:cyclic lactone autoinducer peptide n=1 Tax=Paenibacillus camelliae TaxID=512410 RepID=UPI00203D0ACD|nr:cyclic lactone autoinducer peptide [Paenibacillus camelliae]MCM3634880.1 cyclic lactone autoinducer peptide [Paenibacillus camelliae]
MNNMKQNQGLLNGMRGMASKFMGDVAKKSGEQALESACLFWSHEPKIPTELLKQSK